MPPPGERRSVTTGKPIVIGRNVWIAAGATILGGVTIGENSVVAAAIGGHPRRAGECAGRRTPGADDPRDRGRAP